MPLVIIIFIFIFILFFVTLNIYDLNMCSHIPKTLYKIVIIGEIFFCKTILLC